MVIRYQPLKKLSNISFQLVSLHDKFVFYLRVSFTPHPLTHTKVENLGVSRVENRLHFVCVNFLQTFYVEIHFFNKLKEFNIFN